MEVIGLTGGIATGKSNVSRFLATRHYKIVDADLITHQVQARGTQGLAMIKRHFGPAILRSDGSLDRQRLGEICFSHPGLLKHLVRMIDPLIRRRIIKELRNAQQHGYQHTVLDAPTLFENGYQYLADKIVTVVCSPRQQLERLRRRNHLSISEAEERISSQWPLSIKIALSDLVINSSGSVYQTRQQVQTLLKRHWL